MISYWGDKIIKLEHPSKQLPKSVFNRKDGQIFIKGKFYIKVDKGENPIPIYEKLFNEHRKRSLEISPKISNIFFNNSSFNEKEFIEYIEKHFNYNPRTLYNCIRNSIKKELLEVRFKEIVFNISIYCDLYSKYI